MRVSIIAYVNCTAMKRRKNLFVFILNYGPKLNAFSALVCLVTLSWILVVNSSSTYKGFIEHFEHTILINNIETRNNLLNFKVNFSAQFPKSTPYFEARLFPQELTKWWNRHNCTNKGLGTRYTDVFFRIFYSQIKFILNHTLNRDECAGLSEISSFLLRRWA